MQEEVILRNTQVAEYLYNQTVVSRILRKKKKHTSTGSVNQEYVKHMRSWKRGQEGDAEEKHEMNENSPLLEEIDHR